MKFFVIFILLTSSLFSAELSYHDALDRAFQESDQIKQKKMSRTAYEHEARAIFWNVFPSLAVEGKLMGLSYPNAADAIQISDMVALTPSQGMIDSIKNDPAFQEGTVGLPPDVVDEQAAAAAVGAIDETMAEMFALPTISRKVSLTIVQPITPLFGIIHGYKAASSVAKIEDLKYQKTEENIRLELLKMYFVSSYLSRNLVILNEAHEQLIRFKDLAQSFVDSGMQDKRAVLKIDIRIAEIEKEKARVIGAKVVARKAVMIHLNIDDDSLTLADLAAPPVVEIKSDRELISLMQQHRKEVGMLNLGEEAQTHAYKASIQPLIPTLAFTAGYQKDWDAPLMQPADILFIGGVLQWNIGFDWIGHFEKMKASKARKEAFTFEKSHAIKQMSLETINLTTNLSVKQKEIGIAKLTMKSANENYRIESDRYGQAMTTETDLLNAELSMRSAKTAFLTAEYEYGILLHTIAETLGVSLEDVIKEGSNG